MVPYSDSEIRLTGSRVSIIRSVDPSAMQVGRGPRLTLCPLGEPEKAIGHNEPQIEPWFASFGQITERLGCQAD